MDLHERWVAVIDQPDQGLPLDEAALIIAAHIDPTLDVDAELARLDELAADCPARDVGGVIELLFAVLGLRGDTDQYDDPRNSCLPSVLDRRRGIPISLSVLTIEVGRRVGVGLEGVGMPGHFLVREQGCPEALIDPFRAGSRLDPAGCLRLFRRLHGPSAAWSPDLLSTAPKAAIAARMLANLSYSYQRRDDLAGRRWVAELRAAIPERPAAESLAVATELAATGDLARAARVIERTVQRLGPQHPDTDQLRSRARGLRAQLN